MDQFPVLNLSESSFEGRDLKGALTPWLPFAKHSYEASVSLWIRISQRLK